MHLLDGHGSITEGFLVPVPVAIFEVVPGIAFLAVIPALLYRRVQFGIEPRGHFLWLVHRARQTVQLKLGAIKPYSTVKLARTERFIVNQ